AGGTVTLATTSGLAFTAGDGTADSLVTFWGTLADVNAAMDGMTFTPGANLNGPMSLQISSSDEANTGAGGIKTDADSVSINVAAVNDAPTITSPAGPFTITEDTDLRFRS